ncbi:helix-turn-helix transcriptional regulator [Phyllobacterium sp. P30BS-XVII]|uniref:helix-turn-helix transcriptional regulator n=1 Tax=Phyllobacterium sp. P30BS-XVII TaxID=2587046 RepID=UPI000DD9D790|nr:helix-turn-helix transcriptional regulator [Phyllobacterium sp. P30BS-XVII]
MYKNPMERSEYRSLSSSSDDISSNIEKIDDNWRWSSFPDEQGRYGFKRQICTLQQTSIVYGETSGRLEVVSNGVGATLSFVFMLKGAIDLIDTKNRKVQNIAAGSATSVFDRPGVKAKFYPGSTWVTYLVPVPTLREHFERLMRRPYFQELAFSPLHDFRTGSASALYQTLCYVSEDIAAATSSGREVLAGVYERLLLAKLFMTKPDNVSALNNQSSRRISPRYLQSAEAFMRENIHNSITLDDIAAAAGCSSRALQRMFKEYRDTSPMHILCEYRLSAAHDAIVSGSARNVTDLAMHLQFSNPGRFSSLYRNAYGMSPSAMMRFHEKSA